MHDIIIKVHVEAYLNVEISSSEQVKIVYQSKFKYKLIKFKHSSEKGGGGEKNVMRLKN